MELIKLIRGQENEPKRKRHGVGHYISGVGGKEEETK